MYLPTLAPNEGESACTSAQSDQSLCCLHEETLQPWLTKIRPVTILIRLCEYASWSESSLGAHVQSTFSDVAAHTNLLEWLWFTISRVTSKMINRSYQLENVNILFLGIIWTRISYLLSTVSIVFVCLFVLRFYGPVNPISIVLLNP